MQLPDDINPPEVVRDIFKSVSKPMTDDWRWYYAYAVESVYPQHIDILLDVLNELECEEKKFDPS